MHDDDRYDYRELYERMEEALEAVANEANKTDGINQALIRATVGVLTKFQGRKLTLRDMDDLCNLYAMIKEVAYSIVNVPTTPTTVSSVVAVTLPMPQKSAG
jgi:hypothetical protein